MVLAVTAVAVGAALLQAPALPPRPGLADLEPLNIAHRGASGHAPENTVPAFELAVAMGADVLEMDLQLTADGAVVVIHDGTVDRTTEGTGRVRDLALAELERLDAGHRWRDAGGATPHRGTGARIPTLAQVFEAFPDQWLLLELKTESGPALVDATAELVRRHGRRDRLVVASFSEELLARFRRLVPDVPTSLSEDEARTFHLRHLLGVHRWSRPPAELLQTPVDFAGVPVVDEIRVVSPALVRSARDRGVDVHVFTVDDRQDMHWLLNVGVQGIITNHPDRLADVLDERQRARQHRGDPGLHPGLGVVHGLQDHLGALTGPARALAVVGDEAAYLLAVSVVLWSVDRGLGVRLGVLLLVSASLGHVLGLVARAPRPSFVDPSVAVGSASTFGLPSEHAQHAVVAWGFVAAVVGRRWAWAAAAVLVALLGWSQLQLGTAFPDGVLAGWAVGAGLLAVDLRWGHRLRGRLARCSPHQHLWLAFGAAAALVLAAIGVRLAALSWDLPPAWIGVDPQRPPMAVSGVVAPAAMLSGGAAGLAFAGARGGASTPGPIRARAVRGPIGLVGLAIAWYVLARIFPSGEDPVGLGYQALGHGLLGAWVTGVAPVLFARLGLAGLDRPVEASVTRLRARDGGCGT